MESIDISLRDELLKKYYTEKKSLGEIAQEWEISDEAVRKMMKKLGIARRSNRESVKLARKKERMRREKGLL